MGLYDYRPYVKKITNDRQILFDCDKGYKLGIGTENSLSEKTYLQWYWCLGAPQGATCIDGQWSPTEVPQCHPEQHPRIRNVIIMIMIALKTFSIQVAGQEVSEGEWPPGGYQRGWEWSLHTRPPGQEVSGLWLLVSSSWPQPHDHQQGETFLISDTFLTSHLSLETRTPHPPLARATMSTELISGSSVRMDTPWPSEQTGQCHVIMYQSLIRWRRGDSCRGRQYSYSLVSECFDRPREDRGLSERSNTFILFKLCQNFCECLVLQMSTFRLFGIKSSNF